jgi:hypothetical protein
LQKKAPNALTSQDAELKSAPAFRPMANTSGSPGPGRHEQERIIGPLAQADGEVGAKSRVEIFLPITP